MRSLIIIFLFVFYTHDILAQKAIIKEVIEIAPVSKEKYIFPVISIPGNVKAADKINKQMQADPLAMGDGGYKESIFEHIWIKANGENDFGWVFHDFSYKVYSSTDHYLCLSISFEGGKYEQDQTFTFLFDTFTGDQIKLQKLLNPKGKKWLIDAISGGRIRRVRREMAILKDSIQKRELRHSVEDEDDDEEALRLCKSCLEKDPVSDETLEYYELILSDDRFFVTGSPCSDGRNAMRLIGLLNYKIMRRIKDIEQFLSPYGKKLLLHSAHL